MKKWIVVLCVAAGMAVVCVGLSQDSHNNDVAWPEFLRNPSSANTVQAVFLIREEWIAIDWGALMESRGIEPGKRENLQKLVAATTGYKTGAVSSNDNAIIYYVRGTNEVEWICYKPVSYQQAEMLRDGGILLPLEEMDHAWRSVDEKLIGKDKSGQWQWVESARPIPNFMAKMSGGALVSDSSKNMLIGDPKKYRTRMGDGCEKWEWTTQDLVAPRVSCKMVTDNKGRMREYAIMMGNSVVLRAFVDGLDVSGKEYGRYREEELLPTSDGKEWVHHRITYECIDTSAHADEVIRFYRQYEATAIDAPEDSDI